MFAILAIISIIILLLYYSFRNRNYWLEKGAPQKSNVGLNFLLNMIFKLNRTSDSLKSLYDEFRDKRYFGIYDFSNNILVIRDADLIKQLGIKDFEYFADHSTFIDPESDIYWSKMLFNLHGDKWRQMRSTLSPSFTSSKMKTMFHLMKDCGESFANYFNNDQDKMKNIDMRDIFGRFTNNIIASLAFGIKCDSLTNRNNEFYLRSKELTNFTSFSKMLSFVILSISMKLAKLLNVRMFPKKSSDFFTNVINDTIKVREENNIRRQDMLQLLIDSAKGKYQEDLPDTINTGFATVEEYIKPTLINQSLTNEDIVAQALIFIFGGFDSVSHLMNYLSYELAVNEEIQKKLINEVDETNEQCNGKLTYEALMKMKYLDMVVTETLRKYPTFIIIDRVCVKPYTIKPENSDEKPISLAKGDILWFPNYCIHYDEKYYQNPSRFDPERFNDDNKDNINSYTYLPFGIGPRNCIGSRFALLETKILFYILLTHFQFVVTEKTQVPSKFMKGVSVLAPEKPIILSLKPRDKKPYY